jgi:hypothetical protein
MERAAQEASRIRKTSISIVSELIRLLPDSIVLGSGFFALVTLSYAHGIFFMSLIESIFAYQGIRYLNNYLDILRVYPNDLSISKQCRTGFTTQTSTSLSLFTTSVRPTFPSAPVFLLSVASSYVIMALNTLSKELEFMGNEYVKRYYLARILLAILLLVVVAYRLFYSCDAPGSIAISAILGALVGFLLVQQNTAIFGPSSLNLMGTPLLRMRTATGERMYICPTQNKV